VSDYDESRTTRSNIPLEEFETGRCLRMPRPEKLPALHKAQLAPTWRSGKPLVAIGVQSELDKAAAAILGALAEMHGMRCSPWAG
jgi:hypothetical protein